MSKVNNIKFISVGVFSFFMLCFLVYVCFPLNVKAEEMNYYYERIDVSQYLDEPFQLIVDGGIIEESRFIKEDGTVDSSNSGTLEYYNKREYTNILNIEKLTTSQFVGKKKQIEIKIKSKSNNYNITINNGGEEKPFKYENVNLDKGNRIYTKLRGHVGKNVYVKVKLQKDEKYLYYVDGDSFLISDPYGHEVVKNESFIKYSPETGHDFSHYRSAGTIASVFTAPVSGIYTIIQRDSSNEENFFTLELYKISDNKKIEFFSNINFNEPYSSYNKYYSVESLKENSFKLNITNNHLQTSPYDIASFNIMTFYKDNISSWFSTKDNFIMNYDSIANDSKDLSSGFVHNFETRLERNNDELSIYWNPNSIARFTKKDNVWTSNNSNSSDVTIEENENGYKVSEKENTYFFNINGQIISKRTLNGNVINYEYENNLLKKVINERGQFFDFTYENNKLKKVSDIAGREISFVYNTSFNELNKVIYPNKKELLLQYDSTTKTADSFAKLNKMKFDNINLVENIYNELGAVSYQYDGNGNKTLYYYDENPTEKTITTTLTNPDGTTLSKTHNELGQVIKEKNERGFERTFEYDSEGNKIKETDYKGQSVLYEYEDGNVTKKINPDGTFVLYEYNDYGSVTKMTDVDGLEWLYKYNDKNQLIETIDKKGLKTEFEYDSLGNVVNQKTLERILKRTYDEKGNLVGIELPNSKKSKHEYDALGRQTATILEDGKRFETVYDVQNNVTKQIQPDGSSVSYEYDGFGKKIKEIDEMGRTKTFTYDVNGNLKSENQGLRGKTYSYDKLNRLTSEKTLGKSYSKTYKYDEVGNLIEEKDESDITIKRTYDANNRMLTESNAGDQVQFTYDNMGRTSSKKDAEGNITSYTYNDAGLLSSEKSPNGYLTKYEYDEVGRPTKTIDPKGYEYLTEYNEYGDKVKETNALGKSTMYGYDNNGQLDSTTNALGEVSRNIYNSSGQLIEQKNALDETVSKMKYNASGRVVEVEDGNGNTSRIMYDLAGNVLETYNGEGNLVAKNEYNEFDELIKTTNALNQSKLLEYNLLGLQTKMTDSLGNVTTYSYRPNDMIASSTDANGTTSYNGYDLKGRMTKNTISSFENNYVYNKNNQIIQEKMPGSNILYYSYNAEGDLSGRKNARGDSSSYEYDENGNLIKETTKEGVVTHSYDKLNRKIKSESNEGVITREYDDLNRVIKKTENGKEIGYEYDKRGNLISIIYPDGKKVKYTYDVVGNMLSVTDWKNNVTSYSYNKNNQLVKTIHSNGVVETREYNVAGQMIVLKSMKDDVVITHTSYEYDANGNIKKEKDVKNNKENVYTYDKLGRLTNANNNSYTYSSTGNITSYQINQNGQPAISRTMTYNSDNQLSKVGSDLSTIDKDGNLLTYKLNGKTYVATYDSKNKMVQYGNMYYQYDSEGNRIGIRKTGNLGETTESTSFVVDNDSNRLSRILVETKGGKDTYYVYGLGLISEHKDEKVNTYHFDYRGSTTAMTNENGVIIGEAEYDEYGQVLKSTIVTRFMYNGQHGVENDENGLYYMRTRYYNLDLKKFMNRDTVVGNILESQSLNRYAYVNGNPINFTDPFGMARETVENTESNWLDIAQDLVGWGGAIPGLGMVFDAGNTVVYFARGQYANAGMSAMAFIPIVGDATALGSKVGKLATNSSSVKNSIIKMAPDSKTVIFGEKKILKHRDKVAKGINPPKHHKELIVERYGKISDTSKKGEIAYKNDNMEGHHMVSSQFLKKYGIDGNDGIALNMHKERHKATPTYGASEKRIPEYYNLSPRDALTYDIQQVRKIYRESGMNRKEVNDAIREVINQWNQHPSQLMRK